MKKQICIGLALMMLGSLCACQKGDTAAATPQPAPTEASEPATEEGQDAAPEETDEIGEALDELETLGEVEADRGLFDVTLTLPAEYMGEDTTQASLDQEAAENGWKSATLNEDGSVTLVLTKAQHAEMMEKMKASIDEQIDKMVGSEDFPTITAIEHNDEYTEFTVTLNTAEVGLEESLSTLAFYMYGGMYHIFNGTQADNIAVQFVNGETGEVIQQADSSEMTG